MPKLNIQEIEKTWQSYWEKEKIYKFNHSSKKKIYSIDTPPPTVSGEMHIGHAFSYAHADFIARYKRMVGFNVFYPFGTDDNGLPTEKLIQKLKKVKATKMPREEFIDISLKTLKEISPKFINDWKKLGISCDYKIYYSTIDDNSRKISQKSFLDLYKAGHIYQESFPTIWDTEFQTPVAQAELEDKEQETEFITLKFQADSKTLPIATTRPELLASCGAVFVNPKDKRYKSFVGKKAKVPLFNHEVPIIADPAAKIEKGTGVLMVCSYGDKYDVEAFQKHKLKPKISINKDGTMNLKNYEGLTVKEARKKITKELEEKNLILNRKKIINHVNVFEKSGREIEFLPTDQWFIKILDKKEKLIQQGKKIIWHPSYMFKRYENWIQGLEWDWSISRDRHFGIPIPVWHCQTCNKIILAKENELPVDPVETKKKCPDCKSYAQPETKVLDTWATSSLTPQIAASLVDKIKIPYSLRPQAHDIIRTWAFYTITKSLLHENKIPWKEITISGFVTQKGEKMSKSKGNAIKPQELMEKYGTDATRFWAASTKLGEDLAYQEKDFITATKFITKILNASNFVFMNLEHQAKKPSLKETDRLFLTQLNKLIETTTKSFDDYNYANVKLETEKFFWKIFADNYLEIVKHRVYNGTPEEKASAFYTLYESLLTILKLIAPITPFITEEIYQSHFKKHEKPISIHLSNWPTTFKITKTKQDQKVWDKLLEIISKVRQEKSSAQKSMKAPIRLTLPKQDLPLLKNVLEDLKAVTSAEEITEGNFKIELL